MKRIRFAVGIPAYGATIDAQHAEMWLQLGFALAANTERFTLEALGAVDENPVADARNVIVEQALQELAPLERDPTGDWLLMVDADTYHTGDDAGVDILRMLRAGEAAGAAIIGAPVRARGMKDHPRTVWMQDETPRIQVAGRPAPVPTQSLAPEEAYKGKVRACTRIGAAFMAVNLTWLRRYFPDPPWFSHEPIMTGGREQRLRGYGEDCAFCDAVRIRRGEILVDGRFFPKHVMTPERL